MGVRVVISDFGGVLTSPLEEAFFAWQESSGIPLEELGMAMVKVGQQIGENPLYKLERGEMTEAEFEGAVAAQLRAQLGNSASFEGFAEFYFAQLTVNQPFVDFLHEYKSEGGRLALLTNNVREWEPRWRAMLPIEELFETVVDSGFEGVRKPEPEIYEITHRRIASLPGLTGVEPSECVLVDDIELNCEGARGFGFQAVRYEGECTAVLRQLADLLSG